MAHRLLTFAIMPTTTTPPRGSLPTRRLAVAVAITITTATADATAITTAIALAACGGTAASSVDDSADSGNATSTPDGSLDANAHPNPNADASSSPDASSTPDAHLLHAPATHRPTALECSHSRGAGDFDPTLAFAACHSDAECISGTNGRCLSSKGGAQTNTCSYDSCFTDAECGGSTKVCTCRESGSAANRCAGGNCTIDADCGAGGYCSPSVDPDKTNYGLTGWWCHTAADSCADDTDCTSATNTNAKCTFDPKTAHWACSSTLFLPP
jgi:hypothetical protein